MIGHKKRMRPADAAADELGDWQVIKTSKLVSGYSPDTVERYGAFQSIKHNIDDVQEPTGITSR